MSPTAAPSRFRRGLGRTGLAAAAVLATLAAAELLLRTAASGAVQRLAASRAGVPAAAGHRVLCVGDSYTFGLYWRQEEAWPGRLEQMLNAPDAGDGTWAVVNAGVPAQNTAQVRAALNDQLASLKPEVVVLLAGHNNRWNLADPARRSWLRNAFEGLKLVKVARLAAARGQTASFRERVDVFTPEAVAVQAAGETRAIDVEKTPLERRSDAEVEAGCRADFRAVAEACAAAGARLLLLTYPSPEPGYEAPARAARAVAAERGLALVDLRLEFTQLLATRPYADLLIPKDRHPTDRGHFHIARCVAATLAAQGFVRAGPSWAALPEALYAVELAVLPDGSFEARGPPRAEFRVVVARSDTPPQPFGARTVPVAADDLFERFRDHPECRGRLDEAGRAPWRPPADLEGLPFVAVLVVMHDWPLGGPELQVRGISAAVHRQPR